MKLWGDMTSIERAKAAVYLVRERGLTYTQAAAQLVASKNAIAGALYRSEETLKRSRRQQLAGATKSLWTETRLTKPWTEWRARRRAERAVRHAEA